MRPQKVNDQELLLGLFSVFRAKGYEGTSLNDLAEATGLQKASLYHRYPGGKREIAEEVMSYVVEFNEVKIFQVLSDEKLAPVVRLKQVLKTLDELYGGGFESCLLRTLAMDTSTDFFSKKVKMAMERLIEAFRNLGLAFGQGRSTASANAEKALIMIQGSLILSKATSSAKPFKTSLKEIQELYIEK